MADIGRSTLEHKDTVERHALEANLENWGAWVAAIPNPHAIRSIAASPICRLYIARYAEDSMDLPPPSRSYNSDDAALFDRFISETLKINLVCALVCCYVTRLSSRDAAKKLTMMGYECTHTTYRRWIDSAHKTLESEIYA